MLPGFFAGALRAAHRPALARLSQRAAYSASTAVLSAVPKRVLITARPATRCSAILSRIRSDAFRATYTRRASSSASASADSHTPQPALPTLSGPPVAGWLLLCSTLVFAVVVVGGITRLTESGLSITEWKPVTGVIPPLSHAEWEEEFEKYKATPEFKMLNAHMNVDDFKEIFYMEWGHRVLGRLIGATFVLPLAYFALRRRLSPGLPLRLSGLAVLLGAQGALGWYMVKSGLEDTILTTPGAVPRVSQYRLAAHLGAALVLYAGMFYTGLSLFKDWAFAHRGKWAGLTPPHSEAALSSPPSRALRAFRTHSALLTALVLLTAFSGAFVAGLDAGLLYNEFPLMGGRLSPPASDLVAPAYSGPNNTQPWRNIFENPTTVQFDHRVLGVTTYSATALVFALTLARRRALPPAALRAAAVAFGMANVQVLLGIGTLLYLVPVPLAAAHQAGSVALLTAALHMLLAVRRPSAAARAWRAAATARTQVQAHARTKAAEQSARNWAAAAATRAGPMSAAGAGAKGAMMA